MGNVLEKTLVAARELTLSCADSLTTPVTSAILHGSLAQDDFIPGKSDIDLLMVVKNHLRPFEVDALVAAIHCSRRHVNAKVDLHVVTADVAAAPTKSPPLELYVHGHPAGQLSVERSVAADPDLPAELSMAREHGRCLLGAEPRDVLGPVPPECVRDRGVHWLRVWTSRTDDSAHAELMVLTACRIWRFARKGVHCGKTQAGHWALAQDPSLSAVRQALHQRAVDPATPIDEAGIRHVLDTVRRQIC